MDWSTAAVFLILLVVASADAQDWKSINDWDIQRDRAKPGESEADAQQDLKFDLQITSRDRRPPKEKYLPDPNEVDRLYEEEKERLMAEAAAAGDDLLKNATVAVKWGFQYYNLFDWKKRQLKSCPMSWGYQCKGTNISLPCFYTYYRRRWEWCCPYWPKVFIRRCDCCQCAVLTTACAYQGECHRRYSRQSFIAVCYRNKRWAYLQYMVKYLPSSCYCRI